MNRREFIKYAAVGLAALTMESWGCSISPAHRSHYPSHTGVANFSLNFGEALVEMVDGSLVYTWVFEDALTGIPRFPGPVINLFKGDNVTITLKNNLDEDHAFVIPGVVDSGPIPAGRSTTIQFIAPAAGTYLYFDPLRPPVNRVMGLHGAVAILPDGAGNNPYGKFLDPVPDQIRNLFNDLGTTKHFPGDPWNPDPRANRSRIWLFTQVDPRFNAIAQSGQVVGQKDILQNFLPRYFFISGKTGAFASTDPNIAPVGNIGEPHLIRMLNAGIQTHSPHIHANHCYVTAVNQVVQNNVVNIDTFKVSPLDTVDWLLPFIKPPDIPGPNIPLRQLIPQELATVLITPQSPLMWPMHSHTEIDQTAAGGNYPQGLITHFIITGDVDKVSFPSGMKM